MSSDFTILVKSLYNTTAHYEVKMATRLTNWSKQTKKKLFVDLLFFPLQEQGSREEQKKKMIEVVPEI